MKLKDFKNDQKLLSLKNRNQLKLELRWRQMSMPEDSPEENG